MIEEELARYAETIEAPLRDSLTGLLNHGPFLTALESEVERALDTGHGLSLLLIDVDLFSSYNSRSGFLKGDLALKEIASRITEAMRDGDHAGRCSRDTFAAFLWDTESEAAMAPAERAR